MKVHFGKNISFNSDLVEMLSPSNLENNIIYVKNNQLFLLSAGMNNQYLHLKDGGVLSWEYINMDFDQGVWTVALFSDQYQTIDGYGTPVDPNPSGEFTYPTHMSMPYVDEPILQPTEWIEARYNDDYHLSPYPDLFPLAEIGGVFFAENTGRNRLNVHEYDLLTIDEPIISIEPPISFTSNIPSSIFDEEMTVITTPYYPRSNNDGIWTISASSNYNDNWAPYKIFNKSYNVSNGNGNGWLIKPNDKLPQYVEWTTTINKLVKLNAYSIMMAYDNNDWKHGFKKWKFEGSNDGINWELMHEEELTETPAAKTVLKYNLDKTYEFTHFRLTILDGKDNNTWTGIDEIETFYTGTNI